jgi:hypothetical protein
VKRHVSADELADLAAGALKPRKAGKISGHIAICVQCTHVSEQLVDVSVLLASVQFPPMPERLSVRIEAALATESVQRLSSQPATEAGRRDLPVRGRGSQGSRTGWRMPGLSGPASRLVAAAGALVIIGFGSYEVATHAGGSPSSSSSSGGSEPAALPQAGRVTFGPNVSYQHDGTTKVLKTVHTNTNFLRATLGQQAVEALGQARLSGAVPGERANNSPAPSASAAKATDGIAKSSPDAQLTGCVDRIAAGKAVLLVERAKFEGQPATIIVIASVTPGTGEVWVVSPSCSASDTNVLDHLTVAHT